MRERNFTPARLYATATYYNKSSNRGWVTGAKFTRFGPEDGRDAARHSADDQLRQRVAWSLSQIYIVAVGDIPEARDETEVWLKYCADPASFARAFGPFHSRHRF